MTRSPTGIEVTDDTAVRVITFTRPERRNGMDLRMFRAYYDALADAAADPAVRAVVITGAGGSFCSGATPTSSPSWPAARVARPWSPRSGTCPTSR